MRRTAGGVLVLALAVLLGTGGDPDPAEALTQTRARIKWESVIPYPSSLRGYQAFIEEHEEMRDAAIVLLRGNTLARRSHTDPSNEQVLTSCPPPSTVTGCPADPTQFEDEIMFTPSRDVTNAVILLNQRAFGDTSDDCHVVVTRVARTNPDPGERPLFESAEGQTEVHLETLPAASAPYTVTLASRIPPGSQQLRRPTPRILSTVIRVLERVPSRVTPRPGQATIPPRKHTCSGEIGGRGYRSLNWSFVLRTELQTAQWTQLNGRPTPTRIAVR